MPSASVVSAWANSRPSEARPTPTMGELVFPTVTSIPASTFFAMLSSSKVTVMMPSRTSATPVT